MTHVCPLHFPLPSIPLSQLFIIKTWENGFELGLQSSALSFSHKHRDGLLKNLPIKDRGVRPVRKTSQLLLIVCLTTVRLELSAIYKEVGFNLVLNVK